MFSQTKIRFTQSWLYKKMAEIRLSQIKSSAFKNSSYAGPSVHNAVPTLQCSLYNAANRNL